jgi:uncharacterized protein
MKEIAIVAHKCKKCGRIHFPFHDRCLTCKGREFDEVKPKGDAKLITFSQIFNLHWGFDNRFIFVGVAEFENGIKAMGQIQADAPEDLKLGMKLKPTWDVVRIISGENVYGLKFVPITK